MAAWWDSAVGIHTRDCCEPFHDNWKDVPHLQRAQVRDRLLDWFDIDFEAQDGVFLDVVDKDANICYNNWKNKLNKHFKKSKTVEAAKANRSDSVRDDAQWDRCCERFASEDFKGKSKKCSENRGKHKYKSYHGRRSYMQHRALKENLETRELYSAIRNWKEMHQRGEIWANKNAEETYHKTEEELQRLLAESTSGSASISASASASASASTSASTSGSTSINEVPIMGKVLGTQSGHTTGIGRTLPRSSHRRYSRSSQSRPTYQHAKCETEINTLRMYLSQMLDVVRDLAPNAQLPDIPIAPSSSSATNGGDGDEDNVDTDLDD